MVNLFKKADSRIQKDVEAELNWDPRVTCEHLKLSTENGIVTLSGTVPRYFEKVSAKKAAEQIGGVRGVQDNIEVKLPPDCQRSDEEIARAASSALEWIYQVSDDVKFTVDNSRIILRGEVPWDHERAFAEDAVSGIRGILGVTNEIKIKSGGLPVDIKARIEESLRRNSETEGREITVAVNGNRVVLSGTVHSLSEIAHAIRVAWNAPGVTRVENNMKFAAD